VQFLVEACDPSEATEFAYTANGILVSDFYSVRFFDPVAARGVRYSFTGAIRRPREVIRGGYLSGSTSPPTRGGKRPGSAAISPPSATLGK